MKIDFIKKVKSYKDICKIIGIDPAVTPDVTVYHERDKEAAVSMFRLWNANRAAWGDEEIDWNDWNQRKYEIWADLRDEAGSGSGFSFVGCDCDDGASAVSSHIATKKLPSTDLASWQKIKRIKNGRWYPVLVEKTTG